MHNIALSVAYDGTNYLGWQKTRMGSSIEAELEKVINQILQHPVTLQAASRTDAGVHARGQIVNFFTGKHVRSFDRLKISLNSLLPLDIRILKAEEMPATFHPTIDCRDKEYHYYLCYDSVQLPNERFYEWHIPRKLDIEAMRKAAQKLTGRHDFRAFCNFRKNINYSDYIRTVDSIQIVELPRKRLRFEVRGSSFLYKMVRNLVGTLVYVGEGKLLLENIPQILASQKRPLAGITAPAHGLCLDRINY